VQDDNLKAVDLSFPSTALADFIQYYIVILEKCAILIRYCHLSDMSSFLNGEPHFEVLIKPTERGLK
jgi:hypothetical protein